MLTSLVGVACVFLCALIGLGFVSRHRLRTMTPEPPSPEIGRPGNGWLAEFFQPYRSPLGLGLALILSTTLVDLAAPWPFKIMIDSAIGDDPLPHVLAGLDGLTRAELALVSIAAGLGFVFVGVVINYLITYLIGAAELRIAADIRSALFRRLQELSLRFHDQNRTGDLVSRLMSDVGRVRDVLLAWLDRVIPDVLTLVGVLVIMVLVDPVLTLLALSVVPVLIYYALAKRPQIRKVQREARNRRGELASQATDALRNVRVVQAFSRQRDETDRFRQQLDRTADAAIASLDVSARYSPISSIVLAIGTALVSWVGVLKVLNGELSLGTLLVFLSYLSSLYGPIRSLSRLVSTFAKGAASRDRLLELFDDDHTVVEMPDAIDASHHPASLALRNLGFRYEREAPVLSDLNLEIADGETVCVVGASGVGKSTLLSLLLRLYEPTTGSIELGGTEISRFTISSLRQRIALVPQDPWMMDATIADNIIFGHGAATADGFAEASELALVDDFARKLPRGYDTPVGEGGVLLSGGQRKRVALARALIRDASILLLDEPTSGLDPASTSEVMAAIDNAASDRTVIIVSHDLKLARRAERVVVMENGAAAEVGTHTALLEQRGRYAQMWTLQQGLRLLRTTPDEATIRKSHEEVRTP